MRLRNTLKALSPTLFLLQTPLCHYSDVHNRITTYPSNNSNAQQGGGMVKNCYKWFKLGTEMKPRNALKRSLWQLMMRATSGKEELKSR